MQLPADPKHSRGSPWGLRREKKHVLDIISAAGLKIAKFSDSTLSILKKEMDMPGIALVDDKTENIQPLAFVFARYGIGEISIYNDPSDLLTDMEKGKRPDLVITDFNMPYMSGMELLDTINERFRRVAGIILTGNASAVPKTSRLGNTYPVITKGNPSMFGKLVRMVLNIIPVPKESKSAKKAEKYRGIFLERIR